MIRWFIFVGLVAFAVPGGCLKPRSPNLARCGKNEVYSDKKIVCPPQSCESIYTTYLCAKEDPKPGCNCIDGYLRDANNVCIPSDQCKIPGGPDPPPNGGPGNGGCDGDPNAEYVECTTSCPPTCDEPNPICVAVCGPPGYQCKQGYLKLNGKCVLPEQCPAKGCDGDPNAVFRDCTSACEPTCDNPNPTVCTLQCNPPGCECKQGYVKLNGRCVLPKECPVKGCDGDPNAVFRDCTSACTPTCDNPDPACTRQCNPPGCECKKGYVKLNGRCVLPKECPVKGCDGDPNAEFRSCTSACTPTCEEPNPICILSCSPPGCQCKQGFVKLNGRCRPPSECPESCGGDPNAEFRSCTSACTPTCDNPNPICIAVCRPPGCQCKTGYVKLNGRCVLPNQCPVTVTIWRLRSKRNRAPKTVFYKPL